MFTWLEAAVLCEELYGVETNMKEGYFVCPECGEMLLSEDWSDYNWETCPICKFEFYSE